MAKLYSNLLVATDCGPSLESEEREAIQAGLDAVATKYAAQASKYAPEFLLVAALTAPLVTRLPERARRRAELAERELPQARAA
jgi:hypothetical protein